MFEMIAVFSALTGPVAMPVHPPVALVEPPARVEAVASRSPAHVAAASSAVTIVSRSASSSR